MFPGSKMKAFPPNYSPLYCKLKLVSTDRSHYAKMVASIWPKITQMSQVGEFELAERIYVRVLSYFNRLIEYVRIQKGQFWLQEYPLNTDIMSSEFTKFRSRVRVGETDCSTWYSTEKPQIITLGPLHSDRYLDEDAWLEAKEFVVASEKTRLTWELLAEAELLASTGHTRSALTEAITALEIEAYKFGRDIKANQTFGPVLAERMTIHSLKNQIEHMGLSGTINYLFPIIFTQEQMPTELLKTCQEAISQRQNVVHSGQRKVDVETLSRFLTSIREMCTILEGFQDY